MNCVLKCATLRTKNHVTYESNVSPYFAFAPKYEETFELITYRVTQRFFSSGNNTLQESLYKLQYKEFNWKNEEIQDWSTHHRYLIFPLNFHHFSVFFHGNVYFSLFSGSLGHSVVWLIISWRIIKSHFVVIRFSWILFFKFYYSIE